jgi:hypothetical protein
MNELSMNELEERLCQLITTVCQPEGSTSSQRKNTYRLLTELQHLPGLFSSSHPDYLEALDLTWEWVSENICEAFENCKAALQDGLVKCINGYLYLRLKYLREQQNQEEFKIPSFDEIIESSGNLVVYLDQLALEGVNTPTLSDIESRIGNLQSATMAMVGISTATICICQLLFSYPAKLAAPIAGGISTAVEQQVSDSKSDCICPKSARTQSTIRMAADRL